MLFLQISGIDTLELPRDKRLRYNDSEPMNINICKPQRPIVMAWKQPCKTSSALFNSLVVVFIVIVQEPFVEAEIYRFEGNCAENVHFVLY